VALIFSDAELLPNLIASFKFLPPVVRTALCVDSPVGIRFTTIVIAPGKDVDVKGMKGYESLFVDGGIEEDVPYGQAKTRTLMMCKWLEDG
jgi:hypothetical protein